MTRQSGTLVLEMPHFQGSCEEHTFSEIRKRGGSLEYSSQLVCRRSQGRQVVKNEKRLLYL